MSDVKIVRTRGAHTTYREEYDNTDMCTLRSQIKRCSTRNCGRPLYDEELCDDEGKKGDSKEQGVSASDTNTEIVSDGEHIPTDEANYEPSSDDELSSDEPTDDASSEEDMSVNGPPKGSEEAKARMEKVRAVQWVKNGLRVQR